MALVGTAAIYFGVPYLRILTATNETPGITETMAASETWLRRKFRALGVQVGLVRKTSSRDESSFCGVSRKTGHESGGMSGNSESLVREPNEKSGTNGFAASAGDDETRFWGVVRERSACFDRDGQVIRYLPGGVLVEKIATRDSSVGAMAECRVWHEERWVEPVFIVDSALALYAGAAEHAPEAKRVNLQRYFALRDDLNRRRRELDGKLDPFDPAVVEYKAAKEEYGQLRDRAHSLQMERDREDGGARIAAINELATMRSRVVRAEERLRTAGETLRAARERNRNSDPSADSELKAIQNEIDTLEVSVRKWLDGG